MYTLRGKQTGGAATSVTPLGRMTREDDWQASNEEIWALLIGTPSDERSAITSSNLSYQQVTVLHIVPLQGLTPKVAQTTS